jgi:glycosyltransferase involved in cell wall biosynthesis
MTSVITAMQASKPVQEAQLTVDESYVDKGRVLSTATAPGVTAGLALTPAPLFSVIVPTYNRSQRLQRALNSITAQTMQDFEIIVVDDASTDETPSLLADLKWQRFRALSNESNQGVSGSRNRGSLAACGEFIVFLDDDDQLRPEALACLRDAHLAAPEVDFFWGERSIHQKDAAGADAGVRQDDWSWVLGPLRGSRLLPFAIWTAANSAFTIRRRVFRALGGFDETLKMSEDRELFIRLARNDILGAAVPKVLVDVDEHFIDSLSRNAGVRIGPEIDLWVIQKHREYIGLREHREFLWSYLCEVYCGFLRAHDHRSARRILGHLVRARAPARQLIRLYLRHAGKLDWARTLYHAMRTALARRSRGASPTALAASSSRVSRGGSDVHDQ